MCARPYEALVVLDIDGIQSYVFSPPRLQLMRGASFIVDDFVRSLRQQRLEKDGTRPYGNYSIIYARGGAAEILFESQDRARAFVRDVAAAFSGKTLSGSLTARCEEWRTGESFHECQRRAMSNLQTEKRGKKKAASPVTSIYLRPCEECGVEPAGGYVPKLKAYLCGPCKRKLEMAGRKTKLLRYFSRSYLKLPIDFPREFSDIAQASSPENYLGVVYVDGNRMGDRKKNLLRLALTGGNDDNAAIRTLKDFSHRVEGALFTAVSRAVARAINPSRPGAYPVEFSLAGGDDVMLVLPVQHALPVALEICEHFKNQTQDIPGAGGAAISLSAGVVLAKAHFPMPAMLDMAKQLLKSAKKLNWKRFKDNNSDDPSCIDFQLLDSGLRNLEDIRTHDLDETRGRPLTTDDLDELLEQVRKMKGDDLPLGRLKALQESRLAGPEQALLDYCHMLTRVSEGQRKVLRTHFPEASHQLMDRLPAILELYDFVKA